MIRRIVDGVDGRELVFTITSFQIKLELWEFNFDEP